MQVLEERKVLQTVFCLCRSSCNYEFIAMVDISTRYALAFLDIGHINMDRAKTNDTPSCPKEQKSLLQEKSHFYVATSKLSL